VIALVLGATAIAAAHALPIESIPADRTRVSAPARLVLRFNGRIEPRLSRGTLVGGVEEARSQGVMLVLMVGYTMVSLWILAQPIVEPGS
jgi:methionine-rich copper-binding protein CopC